MSVLRFDNIVEKWAMGYKPVSHDPTVEGQRGKRFFRHDTVEEMQSLAKQLTQANKTDRFVSVVTQMEGELAYMSENEARPKFFEWRRHVLFWVRATQCSGKQTPQDEIAAADAKAAAIDMGVDFISFLDYATDPKKGRLMGEVKVDWDTLELTNLPSAYFNSWHVACLNVHLLEPRNVCPAELKYDMEQMQQNFGIAKFN